MSLCGRLIFLTFSGKSLVSSVRSQTGFLKKNCDNVNGQSLILIWMHSSTQSRQFHVVQNRVRPLLLYRKSAWQFATLQIAVCNSLVLVYLQVFVHSMMTSLSFSVRKLTFELVTTSATTTQNCIKKKWYFGICLQIVKTKDVRYRKDSG